MHKKKNTVEKNKKKLRRICIFIPLGKTKCFLKNIEEITMLKKAIKKYLPQTTCKKWISWLKNFARPSMNGNSIHAEIFKITAFILCYLKKINIEQINIIIIAANTPYFAGGNATLIIL